MGMEVTLECVYLGLSMYSGYCVMTNQYMVQCANLNGLICVSDFFFIKKKDILFHHVLVLLMLHYMNTHQEEWYREKMISVLLSTKISTIFLSIHTLFEIWKVQEMVKQVNQLLFVISFMYYRIYQYSYLMLDKDVRHILWTRSSSLEYVEINSCIYAMFLLNLYWASLIVSKMHATLVKKRKTFPQNKTHAPIHDISHGSDTPILEKNTDD